MASTGVFFCLGLCSFFGATNPAGSAPADRPEAIVLTLAEPLDRNWRPEWVSFPVRLPPGAYKPSELGLAARSGGQVEYRFAVTGHHDDGSVATATAYVYTALAARDTKTFRLVRRAAASPRARCDLPRPDSPTSTKGLYPPAVLPRTAWTTTSTSRFSGPTRNGRKGKAPAPPVGLDLSRMTVGSGSGMRVIWSTVSGPS